MSNYSRLIQSLLDWTDCEWLAQPLAADCRTTLATLAQSGSTGSSLDSSCSSVVQAVALDEVLLGWTPTHIKVDIKGAEPDALEGCRLTLERHRPMLAIWTYHTPRHHWGIPQWISEPDLGYCLYLHNCGDSKFETVVYVIPA